MRATITRHEDGTLEVLDADDTIAITLELLAQAVGEGIMVDEQGMLLLAGDPRYRYRPVRFDAIGYLICERIK